LLGGKILFRRNLMRVMMEKQITATEPIWDKLNLSWAGFFATMGAVNLYVAYSFSTETWVNFKLFGSMGMMLLFVILQGIWLSRHIEHKEESQ
jgi:intracellular septation protein